MHHQINVILVILYLPLPSKLYFWFTEIYRDQNLVYEEPGYKCLRRLVSLLTGIRIISIVILSREWLIDVVKYIELSSLIIELCYYLVIFCYYLVIFCFNKRRDVLYLLMTSGVGQDLLGYLKM